MTQQTFSVRFDDDGRVASIRRDGAWLGGKLVLPNPRAGQVELLPNGGVRATDDLSRLWVGDASAADEDGWIVMRRAD